MVLNLGSGPLSGTGLMDQVVYLSCGRHRGDRDTCCLGTDLQSAP